MERTCDVVHKVMASYPIMYMDIKNEVRNKL